MYSRNSDRRKEIGAYEQLFFNGNQNNESAKLGGIQSVSQGQILSYRKPVIGANKNQQIVDLRGVMGVDADVHQSPEKQASLNHFQQLESTGKKSMIGHSDFVHMENQKALDFAANNLSSDPYIDLQAAKGQKKDYSSLGEVSQLVLATENSAAQAKDRLPLPQTNANQEPQFGNLNMDLSKMSLGGEKTNTMDFIEKMINQGAAENEKMSLKKPIEKQEADDSIGNLLQDFKIPEYNGMQTNLIKNPAESNSKNKANDVYGYSPDSKLNISQGDLTRKMALGTSGTNNSLGTINLDALLQKQDKRLDRIEKYAQDFDQGAINSKILAGLDESRLHTNTDTIHNSRPAPPSASAAAPSSQPKDELKELDTLLFDILKS